MKHFIKIFVLSILLFNYACQTEPLGEFTINEKTLDEELFDLVTMISDAGDENGIDCIRFNYSFVLFVFDSSMEFVEAQPIRSDLEFSNFLGNLDPTFSISLNYPIMGTLKTGEIIEINTNEELKEAIDACQAEELKGKCNNTLIRCVWKVGSLEGHDNDFEGAYYKLNYDGTVQFHNKGDVYFGNWVTLIIGYDVFLNIDLNDGTEVTEFWDANWKVDLRTNERMEIENEGRQVLIEKDCSIPCVETGYQVCELEDEPGVAIFTLNNYSTCIPISYTHDRIAAVTHSFHETEEDALLGINPLDSNAYENATNPQTIYVRTVLKESGEVLQQATIQIEAIVCP